MSACITEVTRASASPSMPTSEEYRDWIAEFGFTHQTTLALNLTQTGQRKLKAMTNAVDPKTGHRITLVAPSRRKVTTRKITPWQVRGYLHELDRWVHRTVFHRHFDRLPFRRRLIWMGSLESPDDNPHLHLLWHVPLKKMLTFHRLWGNVGLRDIWQEITGSGESKVQIIDDQRATGGYIVKQRPDLRDDGHLFLGCEFWPQHCQPKP